MKRLGPQAHLVNMRLNHAVPPSVRLLPAKEYRGAAIGINYDLRVYTGRALRKRSEIDFPRCLPNPDSPFFFFGLSPPRSQSGMTPSFHCFTFTPSADVTTNSKSPYSRSFFFKDFEMQ